MTLRRSLQVAAALGTIVVPLAAFAGSVTTGPWVQPAPALGLPSLFLLGVGLAGVAVYRLRRAVAGPVVAFVLAAGVIVLASLGYAIAPAPPMIMISGEHCTMRTTNTFSDMGMPLMSDCPNLIQILEIQCSSSSINGTAGVPEVLRVYPPCTVGQILANGAACELSCEQ